MANIKAKKSPHLSNNTVVHWGISPLLVEWNGILDGPALGLNRGEVACESGEGVHCVWVVKDRKNSDCCVTMYHRAEDVES